MADIKVKVGESNALKVKVGTLDAIKVLSTSANNTFKDLNDIITTVETNGSLLVYDQTYNIWKSTDNATLTDSLLDVKESLRVGSGVSIGGSLYVTGSSEFVGVVTFRGGTINLGDSNNDDIVISGEFASNLTPTTNNTYDLGTPSKRWRNLYVGNIQYDTSSAENLYVSGISTFVGVTTSTTSLFANNLSVSGITTLNNKVIVNSTDSIQIPVGTSSQRDPSPVTGQIRYNTELSSFEGYGPGNSWGSLGGVKDVNQDTYIVPELSAGSNEDILYFYNAGSNSATISSTTTTLNTDLLVNQNLKVSGTSEFVGVVTFRGGTISIGDSITDDIVFGGEVASDLVPTSDDQYDLGTLEKQWKDLYVSGTADIDQLTVSGISTFSDETNNSLGTPQSGSVQILGGLGVVKNVSIGGDLFVNGYFGLIGGIDIRGGTINIGDSDTDDVVIIGDFASNLIPNVANTYDLGTETKTWKDAYIQGKVDVGEVFLDFPVSGIHTRGVSYIDSNGKIISTNEPEIGYVSTSNYVLTTNENDEPVWTNILDGGTY
jgi:hypothetical protein